MMKRHYVLKSCLGTGKTGLEADVGAVQPGDCCRELLLNHPSKQHLHMCAAEQKLWGWRGTRMVLGRKGKRLEQATSDGSGRDGVFWGHQAMLGRSCPLSKRWKLRLNSTGFEFPNGRAGNWQGAVPRAAAPGEQQNQRKSQGLSSSAGLLMFAEWLPMSPHDETQGQGSSFGAGKPGAAPTVLPKPAAPRPARHSPAQWPRGRLPSKFSS